MMNIFKNVVTKNYSKPINFMFPNHDIKKYDVPSSLTALIFQNNKAHNIEWSIIIIRSHNARQYSVTRSS